MADGGGGFYVLENDLLTNLQPENKHIPLSFSLNQNYPNPFNPKTVISYQVEAHGHSPVHVELSIYNLLGQKVATLVSEKQPTGNYKVEWDASGFGSGIYYYRLLTDKDFASTKKLILLK